MLHKFLTANRDELIRRCRSKVGKQNSPAGDHRRTLEQDPVCGEQVVHGYGDLFCREIYFQLADASVRSRTKPSMLEAYTSLQAFVEPIPNQEPPSATLRPRRPQIESSPRCPGKPIGASWPRSRVSIFRWGRCSTSPARTAGMCTSPTIAPSL